jgi:hypothetical protein
MNGEALALWGAVAPKERNKHFITVSALVTIHF